jgi:hypothetical protein
MLFTACCNVINLFLVSSSPFSEGQDESADLDGMYPRRIQRDRT